jgi:hypothetical protein
MPDPAIESLVERILVQARIPSRTARAELRRELRAHFEDTGAALDDPRDAIRRFGPEALVIASLRRTYAVEYALLYTLKVAASVAASLASALTIELAVNVRIEPRPVLFAMAVVVTVVAAWELARPPADAVRAVLARQRLLAMFTIFASIELGLHLAIGVPFGASRAMTAGAVLTLIAAATIAIAARADRAFTTFLSA